MIKYGKKILIMMVVVISMLVSGCFSPPIVDDNKWEYVGLGGSEFGAINSITFHPKDQNIFYVCTSYNYSYGLNSGLFKTMDNGETWDTLGQSFGGGGNFRDVEIDFLNDSIIYILNGRALYKSEDGGENWRDITGNIHVDFDVGMSDLAIYPLNTDILFVGTAGAYLGYLYKSYDGGENWIKIESEMNLSATKIKFDPNDLQTMYISTSWTADLLKSPDLGNTWEKIFPEPESGLYDFLIEKGNSNNIYALFGYDLQDSIGTKRGVLISHNAGETWEMANDGLPDTVSYNPFRVVKDYQTNDLYLTLVLGGMGNSFVYKLPSGSTTWEIVKEWDRVTSKTYITLSPDGNTLYFSDNALYRLLLR